MKAKRTRKLKYPTRVPASNVHPAVAHLIDDDDADVVNDVVTLLGDVLSMDDVDLVAYTEEQLKAKYRTKLLRNLRDEKAEFYDGVFVRVHRVRYSKPELRHRTYLAYFWLVQFIEAGSFEYDPPMLGLLEIPIWVWQEGCRGMIPPNLRDPRDAFIGRCEVTIDARRRIQSFETNLRGAA